MLRRLAAEQPETFAFTRANQAWAEAQMTKYPEGRQASAIIALLWRAQEQEGWLTRPAIEHVAEMLGLAYIRALEVATFYFMFQLQPVGATAHIQICGTTSCMICGAEDLVAVCREKIAKRPHEISADGQLSWEEVECLGACSNAPMAQIGKDYYEDLTVERLGEMLDAFRAGEVPRPGSAAGPVGVRARGRRDFADGSNAEERDEGANASVALAEALHDTVKRIDGSEVPLKAPWHRPEQADPDPETAARDPMLGPSGPDGKQGGRVRGEADAPRDRGDASDGVANVRGSEGDAKGRPEEGEVVAEPEGRPAEGIAQRDGLVEPEDPDSQGEPSGTQTATEATAGDPSGGSQGASDGPPAEAHRPIGFDAPRGGQADDLKRIRGVGVKLEALCNSLGFWHFDQIAGWTAAEIAWVDANLKGFKGRVTRDEWVKQAKVLSEGGAS